MQRRGDQGAVSGMGKGVHFGTSRFSANEKDFIFVTVKLKATWRQGGEVKNLVCKRGEAGYHLQSSETGH